MKKPIPGVIGKERRSFSHSEGTSSSPESIRNKLLNDKRSSGSKFPIKVKQELLKKLQQTNTGDEASQGIEKTKQNMQTDILKQTEVLSRLEYMTEDKRRSTQEESQSLNGELPTVFTVEQILASKMHKARY